jgi:hypothetical protein
MEKRSSFDALHTSCRCAYENSTESTQCSVLTLWHSIPESNLDDAGEIENPQPHTTAHPPQSLFRQSYPVHSLVDWNAVQMVPFACPESDTDFYNSQFSRSRQLNSNRSEDHCAARSPMGAGMQGFGVLQFEQRAVTSSPPFGPLTGKHNRGLFMAEQRHSPAL